MNVKSNNAKNIWTVIGASSAGTLIEWYDFYIFGSLATIIAKNFFPQTSLWPAVVNHKKRNFVCLSFCPFISIQLAVKFELSEFCRPWLEKRARESLNDCFLSF